MSKVQEIEEAVSGLSQEELAQFRVWFEEKFDSAKWDAEFEHDAVSGRLDALAERAVSDFNNGNFREL
ncbi:hypothetical protein [Candidatus Magnetomonas plexicatena]|uniref:hypothetical protein n=1 Tax=Candidatus Magnetomonas plexicatena TaxID=2552947 RepID=UPI001C7437FD|nr:hypothetical protein E2O03_010610 [Nitrospirales bacterium LBB_01]